MSTTPVSLTQEQFEQYIRPALSIAKRGYACRIPLYKVFNHILYRLNTGCQWDRSPIDPDTADLSKKEIGYMLSTSTTASGARMAAWGVYSSTAF